ncbi:hypothetical protein ACWGPW_20265 [Paenibacillus chitinolyticus]
MKELLFLQNCPFLNKEIKKANYLGRVKSDDFAKEPFLLDESYQKIYNYLAKAIAARDAEVARIQALSKTQ